MSKSKEQPKQQPAQQPTQQPTPKSAPTGKHVPRPIDENIVNLEHPPVKTRL